MGIVPSAFTRGVDVIHPIRVFFYPDFGFWNERTYLECDFLGCLNLELEWKFSQKLRKAGLHFDTQLSIFTNMSIFADELQTCIYNIYKMSRWWQLKYFFYFHPETWGRWTHFDLYNFKGIGSTTNQM